MESPLLSTPVAPSLDSLLYDTPSPVSLCPRRLSDNLGFAERVPSDSPLAVEWPLDDSCCSEEEHETPQDTPKPSTASQDHDMAPQSKENVSIGCDEAACEPTKRGASKKGKQKKKKKVVRKERRVVPAQPQVQKRLTAVQRAREEALRAFGGASLGNVMEHTPRHVLRVDREKQRMQGSAAPAPASTMSRRVQRARAEAEAAFGGMSLEQTMASATPVRKHAEGSGYGAAGTPMTASRIMTRLERARAEAQAVWGDAPTLDSVRVTKKKSRIEREQEEWFDVESYESVVECSPSSASASSDDVPCTPLHDVLLDASLREQACAQDVDSSPPAVARKLNVESE